MAKVIPRLQKKYHDEVVAALRAQFNIENIMAVPRLKKITVNMGIGEGTQNKKLPEQLAGDLAQITGQKPVVTRAKKAAATWKLRQGDAIGAKVTLRRDRMWLFLEKLISIAVPRIRDFSGLNPDSFDGQGNYSMGLAEQSLFPDIEIDKVTTVQGMDICFTISGGNKEWSKAMLLGLGVPLRRAPLKEEKKRRPPPPRDEAPAEAKPAAAAPAKAAAAPAKAAPAAAPAKDAKKK
ncbi:MAG: 50S ribosomal protein L5 [Planctomycetes bacterium]|nr:50S ribosomal protein L5 [Planctomycetota bacterium]